MKKSRDVIISKQKLDVNTQGVNEHMCVGDAGEQSHSINVQPALSPSNIESPLSVENLKKHLVNHPDKNFARKIIEYVQNGVPIGYDGPLQSRIHNNWPSVYLFSEAVYESIQKDILKGRKLGPFSSPPLENFVGSPMGAFKKKHSSKIRVIHDLSWPPGQSVNEHIRGDCSVQYVTIDHIVETVQKYVKVH